MNKLVVALAVLAAACGGKDSIALDDYPQAFRDAFCRNFIKCNAVRDLETCRNLNFGVDLYITASGQAAFDMGKAEFDGEKAQACVDGIAGASCDLTSESQRALPEACAQVVRGTLAAGATCALGSECRSLRCQVPLCNEACCMGACVGDTPPALAKEGESCALVDCVASAYCDFATDLCAPLKPANATCQGGFECQFGLECLGTGTAGTCQALPKPGEACQGVCQDFGTTCSPTSRTCVKVALGGDTCTSLVDCSPLYVCDSTGHCSGGLALGAACTAQQHCADARAFCDVPAGSAMGTCALPKADGMPCGANAHCESHACDTTTRRCVPEPVCI